MADQAHLDVVRVRREALAQALIGLEDALTTPLGDADRWRLRVAMAVDYAVNRIDQHIWETEGPDGFLAEIVDEAPRLSCKATRLRDDHNQLQKEAYELRGILAELDSAEVPERGAALRNQALELLGHLSVHRQRGADLIYEAYQVDIGNAH